MIIGSIELIIELRMEAAMYVFTSLAATELNTQGENVLDFRADMLGKTKYISLLLRRVHRFRIKPASLPNFY